ncbi:hypothetical protein CAEBREN_00024 [Caenorhabditis brenneri]|uniref:Glycosyltransferase family 92 protein n=1 Tax=Caenorhabditis brenneri TaxID=135651 RepID=G0MRM4_CAEBE|nr:hypothetical protein CAEBREN_00024 [Caenorhabditis brenneri]
MDSRRFKLFYIVVVILTFFFVYTFNGNESVPKEYVLEDLKKTVSNGTVPSEIDEPEDVDPKDLPNYKLEGMDRFEWYAKKRKEEIINNKIKEVPVPKDVEISMLSAYEYDVEYTVSITNKDIDRSILYCRYFDEDGEEILPAFQSYNFPVFAVNCEKRKGTKRISISTQATNNYTYPIDLIDRTKKDNYKYEFSFCMAPFYGNESKWLFIAELVEHYRLQGMTHFYFYVYHINQYDNAILQDYVRTGEAEVIYLLDRDEKPVLWQHIVNRDCVLRSRHESKWVLHADLDERLLMTKYPGTILDYLINFNDTTVGALIFRQQWIFKTEFLPEKYEGDKQIDTWLPTLRWHNSSSFGPHLHTTKCIIMPEKVFSMWVHYPKIWYPGYRWYMLEVEEGIVRHYRDQNMQDWKNKYLQRTLEFGPTSLTNYPEKYQKSLTEAVKRRTKYVYEKYKMIN